MTPQRPQLRAVEAIVVPDARHGTVLLLRDTQGIAPTHAVIPPPLIPIVSRFDGEHTLAQIALEASVELGHEVAMDLVERLAAELDEGLFLHGATFRRARDEAARAFAESPVRPASHAGGAYHGDASELRRYLDEGCFAAAGRHALGAPPANDGRRMVALVAPHIDPWRGAVGYGHAYGELARALPPEADTFVVFGTSHAPMREPFALCRKTYATPLGELPADLEAIDTIASACTFDPYADLLNHKREHSIEFQAVFLKHVLGGRPARIVPILAGLGEHQARATDPAGHHAVETLVGGVLDLIARRPGRVVVIAGADLAHVGPRFGDGRPYDSAQRRELERTDRASLAAATSEDPAAFWDHVVSDLDTRRVCGLAPIWSLLRALEAAEPSRGEVLHYEQTVDAEEGSIVSHAAVGYYAK